MERLAPPLLVAGMALCTASVALAQDWTRFRGPNGQGVVADATLPDTFTEADIRWRVPVGGRGHSSPVVFGDALYLTREAAGGGREIVCFVAETGEERWAYECQFDAYVVHRLNSFASSTPAVDGSGVYVVWASGEDLIALALDSDGELRWRRRLGEFSAQHGSGASPIVHGDSLIVANDNAGESFLMALAVDSGETRWKIERPSAPKRASYATPIVYKPDGAEPYLLFASGYGLTAVDPETGAVRWEVATGFRARCVGTPSVAGGHVLLSAGTGGSGKEGAVVRLPTGGEDGDEPDVAYRLRRSIPYVPATLALEDHFYLFADGGIASCLDAMTGDVVWRERLEGTFFSSPVSDGEVVVIADREGRLWSLAVGASFRLLGDLDLGEPVFATPAIARGALYVRTSESLIRLSGAKRAPQ